MWVLYVGILLSVPITIITTTTTRHLSWEKDTPQRPNISEDFSAKVFANLSTENNIHVQNRFVLNRKYTEGKEQTSGCQVWAGRPGETCSYSLVREDLKLEYDGLLKNGSIAECHKSETTGDELIRMWEWISNASYVDRERDKNGEMVDIWHQVGEDGWAPVFLENVVGVSVTDPNKPIFVKQKFRSSENSDDYEFWYNDFTTEVSEDAFNIPEICKGQ